jgi:hypothetical protein
MAAQSKARKVVKRLKIGVVGSNLALGMNVHFSLSLSLSIILSCVGTGLAMGRSPIQGAVPICLQVLTVPKVNSESEFSRGPNP